MGHLYQGAQWSPSLLRVHVWMPGSPPLPSSRADGGCYTWPRAGWFAWLVSECLCVWLRSSSRSPAGTSELYCAWDCSHQSVLETAATGLCLRLQPPVCAWDCSHRSVHETAATGLCLRLWSETASSLQETGYETAGLWIILLVCAWDCWSVHETASVCAWDC